MSKRRRSGGGRGAAHTGLSLSPMDGSLFSDATIETQTSRRQAKQLAFSSPTVVEAVNEGGRPANTDKDDPVVKLRASQCTVRCYLQWFIGLVVYAAEGGDASDFAPMPLELEQAGFPTPRELEGKSWEAVASIVTEHVATIDEKHWRQLRNARRERKVAGSSKGTSINTTLSHELQVLTVLGRNIFKQILAGATDVMPCDILTSIRLGMVEKCPELTLLIKALTFRQGDEKNVKKTPEAKENTAMLLLLALSRIRAKNADTEPFALFMMSLARGSGMPSSVDWLWTLLGFGMDRDSFNARLAECRRMANKRSNLLAFDNLNRWLPGSTGQTNVVSCLGLSMAERGGAASLDKHQRYVDLRRLQEDGALKRVYGVSEVPDPTSGRSRLVHNMYSSFDCSEGRRLPSRPPVSATQTSPSPLRRRLQKAGSNTGDGTTGARAERRAAARFKARQRVMSIEVPTSAVGGISSSRPLIGRLPFIGTTDHTAREITFATPTPRPTPLTKSLASSPYNSSLPRRPAAGKGLSNPRRRRPSPSTGSSPPAVKPTVLPAYMGPVARAASVSEGASGERVAMCERDQLCEAFGSMLLAELGPAIKAATHVPPPQPPATPRQHRPPRASWGGGGSRKAARRGEGGGTAAAVAPTPQTRERSEFGVSMCISADDTFQLMTMVTAATRGKASNLMVSGWMSEEVDQYNLSAARTDRGILNETSVLDADESTRGGCMAVFQHITKPDGKAGAEEDPEWQCLREIATVEQKNIVGGDGKTVMNLNSYKPRLAKMATSADSGIRSGARRALARTLQASIKPGDLHFLFHMLLVIYTLYWPVGLQAQAVHLKKLGLNAKKGPIENFDAHVALLKESITARLWVFWYAFFEQRAKGKTKEEMEAYVATLVTGNGKLRASVLITAALEDLEAGTWEGNTLYRVWGVQFLRLGVFLLFALKAAREQHSLYWEAYYVYQLPFVICLRKSHYANIICEQAEALRLRDSPWITQLWRDNRFIFYRDKHHAMMLDETNETLNGDISACAAKSKTQLIEAGYVGPFCGALKKNFRTEVFGTERRGGKHYTNMENVKKLAILFLRSGVTHLDAEGSIDQGRFRRVIERKKDLAAMELARGTVVDSSSILQVVVGPKADLIYVVETESDGIDHLLQLPEGDSQPGPSAMDVIETTATSGSKKASLPKERRRLRIDRAAVDTGLGAAFDAKIADGATLKLATTDETKDTGGDDVGAEATSSTGRKIKWESPKSGHPIVDTEGKGQRKMTEKALHTKRSGLIQTEHRLYAWQPPVCVFIFLFIVVCYRYKWCKIQYAPTHISFSLSLHVHSLVLFRYSDIIEDDLSRAAAAAAVIGGVETRKEQHRSLRRAEPMLSIIQLQCKAEMLMAELRGLELKAASPAEVAAKGREIEAIIVAIEEQEKTAGEVAMEDFCGCGDSGEEGSEDDML